MMPMGMTARTAHGAPCSSSTGSSRRVRSTSEAPRAMTPPMRRASDSPTYRHAIRWTPNARSSPYWSPTTYGSVVASVRTISTGM